MSADGAAATEPATDQELDRWERILAAPLADLSFWPWVVARLIATVRQRDAYIRAMTAALEAKK